MASILDEIFAAKRTEVRTQRVEVTPAAIAAAAVRAPAPRPFVDSLRAHRPAIIAEVKRASPSKGDIFPGLDPAAVARDYAAAGAAAISVLTDRHFKGSLDDLRAVRDAVDLPLLRKDFIFDPYQLYEARAAGADCILLIAAMLKEGELRSLAALARELEMAALIEVHDADEFALAKKVDARTDRYQQPRSAYFQDRHRDHRNLDERLRRRRADRLGERHRNGRGYRRLSAAGARGFLIGESLLRGGAPRAALTALTASGDGNDARK